MKSVTKSKITWALFVAFLFCVSVTVARVGAQQSQQPNKQQDQKQEAPIEESGQTLKVGTQLVNVLFSITDKQNRYINDLVKEDVTILEDGKPQEIFVFKRELDLPLTMAILVDVSGSEQYTLPQLKEAAGHFIESVIRPGKDTAAIIKFEGEATLMQGLTSNRARLRKGLDDIEFIAPPPVGILGGPTPPINGGSRQGGTSIHDSVVATCLDLLAREPGRKMVLLVTDGQDTTSRMKLADAIDAALKAEVCIYSIGIGDPGYGGVNDGMLKKLSEATGGRAFIPKSIRDLNDAFTQLEQDMRQQYLLAYEPMNETPDGAFRKLEVKVGKFKEKDIRIRHRRGYYAPKG
ncbi:MAG TPA: VWA domain-containing protein [Blastocatellia bacterium]|nr:VWA domain-containing protein [Blastocatellia bacterium]